MRPVILESPFAGTSKLPRFLPGFLHRIARKIDERRNIRYARACLRHALAAGDAPVASHLLYTQPGVLNDDVPAERQWGIDAGLVWRRVARASVVYVDRGVTKGMRYGIEAAEAAGVEIEYRSLRGPATQIRQAAQEVEQRARAMDLMKRAGWKLIPVAQDECAWRKFDGNRVIARQGDAIWLQDLLSAKTEAAGKSSAKAPVSAPATTSKIEPTLQVPGAGSPRKDHAA
ncbi:DUF7768 domain-containing protein [Rhodovibrio sodomensis]|uniref:DUF7768 domain-containing protein n=1 Tax=Rhodovibrio sodomensis TaxID=1088 RepID=UPI0019053F1D|nr:hypothetical protein [Rhodovibrio sodomensis]